MADINFGNPQEEVQTSFDEEMQVTDVTQTTDTTSQIGDTVGSINFH